MVPERLRQVMCIGVVGFPPFAPLSGRVAKLRPWPRREVRSG
jgi:hypothetical protein